MVQQNSGQGSPSPLHELRQRLGLPPVVVAPAPEMISDDKELLALGQALSENTGSSPGTTTSMLEVCCLFNIVEVLCNGFLKPLNSLNCVYDILILHMLQLVS